MPTLMRFMLASVLLLQLQIGDAKQSFSCSSGGTGTRSECQRRDSMRQDQKRLQLKRIDAQRLEQRRYEQRVDEQRLIERKAQQRKADLQRQQNVKTCWLLPDGTRVPAIKNSPPPVEGALLGRCYSAALPPEFLAPILQK